MVYHTYKSIPFGGTLAETYRFFKILNAHDKDHLKALEKILGKPSYRSILGSERRLYSIWEIVDFCILAHRIGGISIEILYDTEEEVQRVYEIIRKLIQ